MNISTKLTRARVVTALAVLPLISLVFYPVVSFATGPVINQGTTTSYAILAGTSITNTGPTSLSGNAGTDYGFISGSAPAIPGGTEVPDEEPLEPYIFNGRGLVSGVRAFPHEPLAPRTPRDKDRRPTGDPRKGRAAARDGLEGSDG